MIRKIEIALKEATPVYRAYKQIWVHGTSREGALDYTWHCGDSGELDSDVQEHLEKLVAGLERETRECLKSG